MAGAPQFWEQPPGLAAALLSPLAAAWEMAGRLHRRLGQPYRPPVPVVCVGNLVLGGAGKTPVVIALGSWLAARGVRPHAVGRGYRGRLAGPVRVDPLLHDAAAVGDEALLIARSLPCWVARDRAAGIRAAAADGAEAVLVDDGFQNPEFTKTLSLLVVDAAYGFGNGRVVPAGPLRERLPGGLARADAVVLLSGNGKPGAGKTIEGLAAQPVVAAQTVAIAGERLAGVRLVAFAGIGRPEKFFAMLRGLGADLVEARAFPDHHTYRTRELTALRRAAHRTRSSLITTAKDLVRMPSAERGDIEVLEITIRWLEPDMLSRLMAPIRDTADGVADLPPGR